MRLAMLVLAGCGRVAFDPVHDASAVACASFGPWSTPSELVTASTSVDDYGPTLSADNLTIYFQSGAGPRDIYMASRASEADPFDPPVVVSALSSPAHEQGPTLSTDELTLYFGSDRTGSMRLYRSTRATTSDLFGSPSLVSELANEDCWGPALSADGSELFFTHQTTPTQYETWRATYTPAAGFVVQGPVTEINGPMMADGFPSLSGDGKTLYWGRGDGLGGSVIYMATRTGPGAPFEGLTPAPIQTVGTFADDPDISRDGRFLVFASDAGTTGATDLMMSSRECLAP